MSNVRGRAPEEPARQVFRTRAAALKGPKATTAWTMIE